MKTAKQYAEELKQEALEEGLEAIKRGNERLYKQVKMKTLFDKNLLMFIRGTEPKKLERYSSVSEDIDQLKRYIMGHWILEEFKRMKAEGE